MGELVVVVGVPGAGKTSVVEKALEHVKNYKVLVYGTIMFEEASKKNLVKDRDDMRKLSHSLQKKIQKLAAKKIARLARKADIILDTHCMIRTPMGYLPGMPDWVLNELSPDKIVLVEADISEIAFRRKDDDTRVRDLEDDKDIAQHQELNRATAAVYATKTGAMLSIIQNHDNGLETAAEELSNILGE